MAGWAVVVADCTVVVAAAAVVAVAAAGCTVSAAVGTVVAVAAADLAEGCSGGCSAHRPHQGHLAEGLGLWALRSPPWGEQHTYVSTEFIKV